MMPSRKLVLQGLRLIDGSGRPPIENATIVIDGALITYAGPATVRFGGPGVEHHSLDGKTVVPGLIEAHTHAAYDSDMYAYLKNGITTIRFAGLNQADVTRLCGRIEAGEIPGPRILSCGPMIDQPPPAYPEWSVSVAGPKEAGEVAERLIVEHDLHSLIVTQRVTVPVMRAVIDVAHAHDRRVVGQTWTVDGAEAANLGIDELHTTSRVFASKHYPKERLLNYATIADRLALTSRAWATIDWETTLPLMEAMIGRGVAYCGMQVITQYQVGDGVAFLETDKDYRELFSDTEREAFRNFVGRLRGSWTEEDVDYGRRANDNRMEWMRRFREQGGTLLVGTDMQFGGIMLHRELANLEALGLSRLEVITAATGGAAKALKLDHAIGLIKEGSRADIVVLNRDPSHDLSALRDICWVMKDGTDVLSDNP
jgi:Amidohydrolase family